MKYSFGLEPAIGLGSGSGFLLCNLVTYKQVIVCDMSCNEFEAKRKKKGNK